MTEKVWLKNYPPEIPHEIDIPKIPVHQYLTDAYKANPTKIAIHFMGKELTYKELYESALKFANYLQSLGVGKGRSSSNNASKLSTRCYCLLWDYVCRWNCCTNKSTIYRT